MSVQGWGSAWEAEDQKPMLENSLPDRSSSVVRKKARSAMTNGAILPGIDGRSIWARRLRDLVALHITDLGGDANVSEAERAIIRRAAVIITELERMERDFALSEGAPGLAELEVYQRLSNTMRRLLEAVGLQRRARDVTPSLADYLDEIVARREQAEDSAQDGQEDVGGGPGGDESEVEGGELGEPESVSSEAAS